MIVQYANFISSHTNISQCPPATKPEYAFIGRSNVGKSSLLNMLTGRNKLAKVSQTPGKTQLINYFLINEEWYLVDLPGYGYAKVSKTSRAKWQKMIRDYLAKRLNLQCTFVLIDSRVPPQKIDIEFINWLGEMFIPYVIVYTKTDKLKPPELSQNVENFQTALLEHWEVLPQQFYSSATKKTGKEDILDFIDETNKNFDIADLEDIGAA